MHMIDNHTSRETLSLKSILMKLEQGSDPNELLSSGDRPIHLAIKLNDPDALKTLLEHGADVSYKNARSMLPLVLVCVLATSAPEWPETEQIAFERIVQLVLSRVSMNTSKNEV